MWMGFRSEAAQCFSEHVFLLPECVSHIALHCTVHKQLTCQKWKPVLNKALCMDDDYFGASLIEWYKIYACLCQSECFFSRSSPYTEVDTLTAYRVQDAFRRCVLDSMATLKFSMRTVISEKFIRKMRCRISLLLTPLHTVSCPRDLG